MLGITRDEIVERIRKSIPLGRWGEPEGIAHMVAFLCSPAAAWVTGEVMTVSGGLLGVAAMPPKREKKARGGRAVSECADFSQVLQLADDLPIAPFDERRAVSLLPVMETSTALHAEFAPVDQISVRG